VNPYHGYNLTFKTNFYRKWFKSDNNFTNYKFTYNHYYTLKDENTILATRLNAVISSGDVPFQGKNVVGQDDIRGYSSGKYRDNQVYALQAEYRWRFYKRFGMVGFAGIASAVEKVSDIFESELLPGAGVGIRYLMIPKERINIGIDVAKGKGDWGLYFRIGESFGR
jgi:outer membrane protein assembly factor BamA